MNVLYAKNIINSKKGKFFSVTFKRKTNKYEVINGQKTCTAHKGDLRTMLCRRSVTRFTNTNLGFSGKPKNTVREDDQNDVLTVFDIGVYNAYRNGGLRPITAGRRSYRRINLREVVSIS